MDTNYEGKRSYETPSLLEHGTIEELTQRQKTFGISDGDFIGTQGLLTISGLH